MDVEDTKKIDRRGVKVGDTRGKYTKADGFELRKSRGLKMTDQEWLNLKLLGGPKWVRAQILIGIAKLKR